MLSAPHIAAVLETVGEGVVTVNAEQRIVLVNREAERIFGYEAGELLGRSVQLLIPDRYRDRHDRGFRSRLEAPESASREHRELEGLRKDGTHFPIELRFTHVVVEGTLFFTAALRDVTHAVESREEIARLREALERERDYLREEVKESGGFGRIIGESPAIRMALAQIEAVAKTDTTVLVTGESGVGKELFARHLHEQSARHDQPLVRVNCASVPESLFESEFFGHRRGAFTGAIDDREGRFQTANGGTIFLDEIGEVPPALQAKLLRVLQEREFEPVGSDKTERVDVRVVAATNRSLIDEVAAKRFREDLYYRLGVFPIEIPPLRERGRDVLLLAEHFIQATCQRLGVPRPAVSKATADTLLQYPWPGNVRELQNVIERGAILARGNTLQPDMLGLDTRPRHRPAARHAMPAARPEPTADEIRAALEEHGGTVSRAAASLGLSRQSLYRRMDRLGLRKGPSGP